jgi:hypothetical protein
LTVLLVALNEIIEPSSLGLAAIALVFTVIVLSIPRLEWLPATVAVGIAMTGLLVLMLDSIPLVPNLTTDVVYLIFGGFSVSTAVILRRRLGRQPASLRETWGFLLGLVSASVLVVRWPTSKLSDYFAFLSFEDNAAWVQSVAAQSQGNGGVYVKGRGGYVIDPLLGLINRVQTWGAADRMSEPGVALMSVTATYALLMFLGMAIVASLLSCVRTPKQKAITPHLLIPVVVALMYVALQIPRTTGHLTFIGALVMLWALTNVSLLIKESEPPFLLAILSVVLLVGLVGMWWPTLPVAAVVLVALVYVLLTSKVTNHYGSVRDFLAVIRLRSLIISAVAIASVFSLVIAIASRPFAEGFSTMSVREFFIVKGGLQPMPPNVLFLGAICIGLVQHLWAREGQDFNSRFSQSIRSGPLLLVGIFGATLAGISEFVAPDYTVNYSAQKVLLLFGLGLAPFVGLLAVLLMGKLASPLAPILGLLIIYGIGQSTIGWSLNTPRSLQPNYWMEPLLDATKQFQNGWIFCTTADPARNFDAYHCSRHAAALQGVEEPDVSLWRELVLNPTPTDENRDKLRRFQDRIDQEIAQGTKITVFSLEDTYSVAEEDAWWMSELPVEGLIFESIPGS